MFSVLARADASSSSPAATSPFIESNLLRTSLNSGLAPAKFGVLKSAIHISYATGASVLPCAVASAPVSD